MSAPRGGGRPSAPAGQRRPTPRPRPRTVDTSRPPEDVPAAEGRCGTCRWGLLTDLVGDLWCPNPRCAEHRHVVGMLVTDRAASERLRQAIAQATQEASTRERTDHRLYAPPPVPSRH